ncbi:MAG: Uma2 family endonuclease [Lachnospiraceae bacterium]|nr:Uma2 family endonuclease [Lachnospiraceae bacterium]
MYRDILREKKERAGWTTEELSNRSGVPVGTINKILSGETASPRYDTMEALNRAFREEEALMLGESAPYAANDEERLYTLDDYYRLPNDVRAELIDGRLFYMQSPTSAHQNIIGELYFATRLFIKEKNGTCQPFMAPLDVQLDCDDKTMIQPDFMIICDREKVWEDRIYGAPDFVVEVLSPSTRKRDTDVKLLKYKNAGVREYWIVDLEKERIICYFFEEDGLIPNIYTFQNEVPVRIYDGELKIRLISD